MISRQVPEPGNYQTITGRNPVEGTVVMRWLESNSYSSNYVNGTIWIPSRCGISSSSSNEVSCIGSRIALPSPSQ